MLKGSVFVGVEFIDGVIEFFCFKYFKMVIYFLGFECGEVFKEVFVYCDYVIKILISFCVNVGVVVVIVMYDCLLSIMDFGECFVVFSGN